MVKFEELYSWTVLLSVLCLGCAPAIDARVNSVGTRTIDGQQQSFATPQELLVAGLVDDAMGLSAKNRFFEAEGRLRQARYLAPDNQRVLFDLALVLDQIGQGEEAVDILKDLNQRKPDVPDRLVALANAHASLKDYPASLDALKRTFRILKNAKNLARASRVARSIASVSFAAGLEADALCYSYEAFALAPSAEELGSHGQIVVAQGLYVAAQAFLEESLKQTPALGKRTSVLHALALARFAVKEYQSALEAETKALDFVDKEPELGGEVNAVWYIMREKLWTGEESESEKKVLDDLRVQAIDYRELAPVSMMMLPPEIVRKLQEIPAQEE